MPDLLERLRAALADRYAIESEIGRGGMAVVFLAEDVRHHRQVAIKVLHPELTATLGAERFLQEIEIVAGLQHPHILPLYESGEVDRLLYYVMPFAEGESLRHRLDREKQLAVDESVRIAVEVADGLDYAHQKGVVHRDIKPGNILLSARHAVIADFGIARAVEAAQMERITSTGLGVGTPLYASPEQATAQETLDGRTDIYSLGCVLYEMLSGEPPLSGATPQIIQARRVSETPSPLHNLRDTVPPALDTVMARALAKIPADRYATASQFGQAMQAAMFATTPATLAALESTPSTLTQTPRVSQLPSQIPGLRRFFRAGLLVVAASVLAIASAWYLRERGGRQPDEAARGTYREVRLTHGGQAVFPAISPDGARLAYAASEGDGGYRIVLRSIDDSLPERALAVVDWLRWLEWLPDGSGLVFGGSVMGSLGNFVLSEGRGRPRRIHGSGRFSPDRNEALRWKWLGDYILTLDANPANTGSTGLPIVLDSIPVAGEYGVSDAAYSPSGDYIAVATIGAPGIGTIWLVSREGNDERVLVADAAQPYSLFWRADGRALHYVVNRTGGTQAIMRILIDRSGMPVGEPQLLLEAGADAHRTGFISEDGRRLVIARDSTTFALVRLRELAQDSFHTERLVEITEATLIDFIPSPDGQWLAYLVEGSLGADVYRVPMDGGPAERVTMTGDVRGVQWSPDSQIMAFTAYRADTLTLWFVPAAGGRPIRLLGSHTSGQLAWAPGPLVYQLPSGGLWLADSLHVRVGNQLLPLTAESLVHRLDSPGEVEQIGGRLVVDDTFNLVGWPLVPSPDGRWLAARNSGLDRGLWKLSLTGSPHALLRNDEWSERSRPVAWTPDGEGIYFAVDPDMAVSAEDFGADIMLMPSGGGATQLALAVPRDPAYSCGLVPAASESDWVCAEIKYHSDIWLIENFDPHVN